MSLSWGLCLLRRVLSLRTRLSRLTLTRLRELESAVMLALLLGLWRVFGFGSRVVVGIVVF